MLPTLSEDGLLRLEKDVHVTSARDRSARRRQEAETRPPTDVVLHGSSLEMGKQTGRVVLAGPATATTPTQELSAGQMTVLLDDQNRAQTLAR